MLIIVAGMAVVWPASGGDAYLPRIGPVPLRFELATAPGTSLAWLPLRSAPGTAGKARTSVPVAGIPANATNEVAGKTLPPVATNNISISASSPPAADPKGKTAPDISPDPVILTDRPGDSPDLVMPQQLATFFQPARDGKNTKTAVILMPDGVGFTPPMPKAATESRAGYQTQ
jgi:hypothetical protein